MRKLIAAAYAVLTVTLTVASIASAQEPANPVQFKLACTIPWGQSVCSAQVPLPPGKRIVIETITVSAYAPPTDQIRINLSTTSANLSNAAVAASHWVALTPVTGGVLTYYYATHRVRIYGQAGSTVSINGHRFSSGGYAGTVGYEVWCSGYLLP